MENFNIYEIFVSLYKNFSVRVYTEIKKVGCMDFILKEELFALTTKDALKKKFPII